MNESEYVPGKVATFFFVVIGLAIAALAAKYLVIPSIRDQPAIIVAAISVVGTYWLNQKLQRRVEREQLASLRREKVGPLFEDFFALMREWAESPDGEVTDEQLERLNRMQDVLTVWGSPELVAAWARFRRESVEEEPDFAAYFPAFLKQLRLEFGHDDSSLEVRDLLRLFVEDADEVDEGVTVGQVK